MLSNATTGTTLITGGAGFVGTNLALRLLEMGRRVVVLDDLSRAGVEQNLAMLRQRSPLLAEVQGDVRDPEVVQRAVVTADEVFHFAAQVSVTGSLVDPVTDFEINAGGTLNVLEAVRAAEQPPALVFTSTNKVYGALSDLTIVDDGPLRCRPAEADVAKTGIDERRPIDFHSPYGCSKGAADQYVVDFARTFGLPAVVLRMSCIYGPHQHGTADQGWVAHFARCALAGQPVTIYGDGRQVRDLLFVDDLVRALLLVAREARALAGRAFNVGGGPANTVSLLELLNRLGDVDTSFAPARTGDQHWYISDTRALATATGWRPRVGIGEGVDRLRSWLASTSFPTSPSGQQVLSAAPASATALQAAERVDQRGPTTAPEVGNG